jgi:hypothetical protein
MIPSTLFPPVSLSVEQAEELLYWTEIGPRANTHQYALGSDKSLFFFTPTAF